jgi:hypothetical protein
VDGKPLKGVELQAKGVKFYENLLKAKDEEIANKSDLKPGTLFALEDADNAVTK